MLNYEFPPVGGGAGISNYFLLRQLAKKPDLAVDLVTSSAKAEREEVAFGDRVRIFRLPVGKGTAHYWTVREVLHWYISARRFAKWLAAKHDYDLCHCWSGWPSGLIGYGLRKRMPYLVALRGSDVPGYNPRLRYLDPVVFRPLSRVVWQAASAVTCISASQAALAAKSVPEITPVIIGNGVDTRQFKPGLAPDRFTILFVGRLIERKGLESVLRAVAGVTAAGHECRVVVAGSGPELPKLVHLSQRLGIADRVEMLREVPHAELPRLYARASVFVLPAHEEAMGNALLEAMAAGLPLITTRHGIMDLMDDNGLTVSAGNHREIEQALLRYLRDPALRQRHGQRSREIAKTIGWDTAADHYGRLYSTILKRLSGAGIDGISSTARS